MVWLCFAPALFAAEEMLRAGEAALRDHLLAVAEAQFSRAARSSDPENPLHTRAVLGMARTQLAAGRPRLALESLGRLPVPVPRELIVETRMVFADAELAAGRPAEALVRLEDLGELEGEVEIRRARLTARARFLSGEPQQALAHLEERLEAFPGHPSLLFEKAELLAATERPADARPLWTQVADSENAGLDRSRANIRLAEAALEAGDAAAARARLDRLMASGGPSLALEARVYPLLASIYEAEGEHEEAARVLRAWETHVRDGRTQAEVKARRAHMLILGGNLEEGNRLLLDLIANHGDEPLTAVTQILLAETLLGRGDLEGASSAFERYLSVFTDPTGLFRATLGLASIRRQEGRLLEAESLYERAWRRAPVDFPRRPELLLAWADTLLAVGRPDEARERYNEFLVRFPEHPLVPNARFQAALSQAELGGLEPAMRELGQIRSLHPDSPLAERAMFQQALLLQRFLRLERALGAFDAYLDHYPEGSYVADAITDKGITAYRLGLFDLALRQFDEVLATHPESPRAQQAFFMRGWALYLSGRDEEALRTGREFLVRYPESPFGMDVRFWLAEHAFNRGDFATAGAEFLRLAGDADDPLVASKAHDLAGRAAMARREFNIAEQQFKRSLEIAPNAPHAPEALFHKGDTLTELNRFDSAILAFGEVMTRVPGTLLALAARGRIGDCHFTLGDREPERFAEALAAYRAVDESSGAPPGLRLQAAFKIGRTLEAMGRREEALTQYMQVVYRFIRERARHTPDAELYFLEAATAAAQMYEAREDWRKAIQVYRHIVDHAQPGPAGEAEERIQALRREHRILF